MADIISHRSPPDRLDHAERTRWSLISGVAASGLAATYLAAAFHAWYGFNSHPLHPLKAQRYSDWFPLELFVIAISPALAGFIFLWSERRLQTHATHKLLRTLAIFGFGVILAIWAAIVLK